MTAICFLGGLGGRWLIGRWGWGDWDLGGEFWRWDGGGRRR